MGGFTLTLFGALLVPWTTARRVGLALCETFFLFLNMTGNVPALKSAKVCHCFFSKAVA